MESLSFLAFSKSYHLYPLECVFVVLHTYRKYPWGKEKSRCGEARTKPWSLLFVCFCKDSVSLKAKNTNLSTTQEFLLHCRLWCPHCGHSWHLYPKARIPQEDWQRMRLKRFQNRCWCFKSRLSEITVCSLGAIKTAACIFQDAMATALQLAGSLQGATKGAINLTTCLQILWSILDTKFS